MMQPRSDSKASISRRGLLRASLQGAAGAALVGSVSANSVCAGRWLLRLAGRDAESSSGRRPTLVVVFLRGGADGLNIVVPHADDDYYRMRPGLAIPRPGERGGALDLGGGFGLHPALAPLMPLAQSGVLAALHAVGHPDNSRSHFEEQDRWELAHPGADLGTPGWLGRYLAASPPRGPIRSIALGQRVPRSLRGKVTTLAVPGLDGLTNGGDSTELDATLRALKSAYGGASAALRADGAATLDAMRRLGEVAARPFEAKGTYPADDFGRRMKEVARLVRADLGVEVIQLDLDGFDTHRNQAQPLQQRMASLGASMAALRADLADRLDDVLVLTVSEFGRTARVNGTRGTDHGGGSCLLAMGGRLAAQAPAAQAPAASTRAARSIEGGAAAEQTSQWRGVLGDWPTLASNALHERRDVRITTDIRDVYADVLTGFLGAKDLTPLLPHWTQTPTGLFARPV